MTGQGQPSAEPAAHLPATALDALLPGGVGWPPASACIAARDVLDRLPDADCAWLATLPLASDWAEAWRQAERKAPERFGRTLAALYDAYYRSPPVEAVLLRHAQAGPRDPDRSFDLLFTPSKETAMGQTGITLASPPGVAPASTYEHAARAGDFIYVAGQVARDENGEWVGLGDAGKQAVQVYRNIGRILAHMGAGPQNVVKIMVFLTDRADRDAITKARLDFFGDHRPPHSGILVGGLGSPEVKVEVEVIAYLPQSR